MATINVYSGVNYTIDVNALVNNSTSGAWTLGSPTITHNSDIGSYCYKTISSLVLGNTYRVTYTISSYSRCNVQMFLGTTPGTIRTAAGTYTETLVLNGSNKRISFYSSGGASISSYTIEQQVTTINDTPITPQNMENHSWTLSYNPLLNQWLSFHSYVPNNYLIAADGLLAKRNDTDIMLTNSGNFGQFFDIAIKPFILEVISNEERATTKVYDSITVAMDTYDSNNNFQNTFFDNGIIYTENQCSGTITFNVGTNVTRKERNWNFNKFQDLTNNLTQNIFVSDWNDVQSSYPIDKVINVNRIDNNKPWYQRGRMRDKYLAVRFIGNNTSDNKFTLKFVLTSFRVSQR